MSYEYIWMHKEALGNVVKILCNPLCAGVRYALSLILSQLSGTHSLCLAHRLCAGGGQQGGLTFQDFI